MMNGETVATPSPKESRLKAYSTHATPAPTVGETLQAARERKGVDLYRAERDTKIRARHLAALESGDYTELPGSVYTKGFLRNYALYLGLDPEELLSRWRDEQDYGRKGEPVQVTPPPQPLTEPRRGFTFSPGILIAADSSAATIASASGDLAYEVLLPAYLTEFLLAPERPSPIGARLTLHTLHYLDSLNQGSSFIPRLVGFGSPRERDFFELLTTVKGLGNRRALRALAIEPGMVARAIVERDNRVLQRLPEIGFPKVPAKDKARDEIDTWSRDLR